MSEEIKCDKCGHVHIMPTVGERGPKGDKGDQGPRGLQGERGFRGERGPSGEGISFRGTVPSETQLPKDAVVGDAYIVKGEDEKGHLFVYTDSGNNVYKWLDAGQFQGDQGKGLAFNWRDTELGVRVVGEDSYSYRDLQGPRGPEGPRGERGKVGPAGEDGSRGPKGPKGDVGEGLQIKGSRESESQLPETADVGDGYIVNGKLFVYTGGN